MRIGPRSNGTISLDPRCRVKIPEKEFLDVDSKLFSKVHIYSKRGPGSIGVARDQAGRQAGKHQNPQFYVQRSSGF